jgi:hypothetical protein
MFQRDNETKGASESPDKPAGSPPSISLPKGGGAIRGIGEKFAANPVTHCQLTMIALRQDMCQPDRRHPSPTQSLLQPVARNMPIQYRWQPQSHHHLDQQHEIVATLCSDGQFGVHSPSLPGNSAFDQPITRMVRKVFLYPGQRVMNHSLVKMVTGKEPENTLLGLDRNVLVLGATSFLTDASNNLVFPLMALFLDNVLGVKTSFIGLVEGVVDCTANYLASRA